MAMSICTGLKQQAGDGMGEKKERGRFTLRFNEGDPIHETAIGLLELQSPRTKAQYVANAVVYYNEHFGQEPQPLNASIISKEAVVAIVKEILRQIKYWQSGCVSYRPFPDHRPLPVQSKASQALQASPPIWL